MSGTEFSKFGLDRMHAVLSGHVEHGGWPGIVSVVARRGETHVDTFGTMTRETEEPMRRDAIFRISSMTKPVTAVATLILVEECVLRLDEPVDRWLPELADRRVLRSLDAAIDDTVPATRAITVRDLLLFVFGFGGIMAPPGTYPIQDATEALRLGQGAPAPDVPPAPDEWMRRFGTLPLMEQPGEQWRYATGSDVLGVLVARAAGQPFAAFLDERVFGPLGMTDTGFHVPASQLDRFTPLYTRDPEAESVGEFDPARGGQWSRPPAFPSGAGGLVSTADDYLAFAEMLHNGGRRGDVRILSRPTVETMTTDHLTSAQKATSTLVPGYWDAHGWGFGVSVVTRRDEIPGSVGTYGWDGGLGTVWRNDPREDLTTILLTSRTWESPVLPPVFQDFLTTAYAAIDD